MKVKITTPCRLHFSLIDLNGSIGRIDGGLGVALNNPQIIVEAELSNEFNLNVTNSQGYSNKEITEIIRDIMKSLNIENKVSLKIQLNIPAHKGLGSKTQLSLAISKALCLLNDIEKSPYELAKLTKRAGTSRIGLTAFERGGFILDGGHSFGNGKEKHTYLPSSASSAPPAPLLAWEPVPDDWYFVVTIPRIKSGAYGIEEIEIFQQNCPISLSDVRTISHIILMKILPAIKQKRIEDFGQGIYEIQGMGFKKIEIELQDGIILDLINFYMNNGAYGAGMSSFGPVNFALVKGSSKAQNLQQKIIEFLNDRCKADIFITNVNNIGAQIQIE